MGFGLAVCTVYIERKSGIWHDSVRDVQYKLIWARCDPKVELPNMAHQIFLEQTFRGHPAGRVAVAVGAHVLLLQQWWWGSPTHLPLSHQTSSLLLFINLERRGLLLRHF